jgi:hypothetical protein
LIIITWMLYEDILIDIMISAADSRIRAPRAILSTRSPIFRSMFSHELKEDLSTVDIFEMSLNLFLEKWLLEESDNLFLDMEKSGCSPNSCMLNAVVRILLLRGDLSRA